MSTIVREPYPESKKLSKANVDDDDVDVDDEVMMK